MSETLSGRIETGDAARKPLVDLNKVWELAKSFDQDPKKRGEFVTVVGDIASKVNSDFVPNSDPSEVWVGSKFELPNHGTLHVDPDGLLFQAPGASVGIAVCDLREGYLDQCTRYKRYKVEIDLGDEDGEDNSAMIFCVLKNSRDGSTASTMKHGRPDDTLPERLKELSTSLSMAYAEALELKAQPPQSKDVDAE